MDEWLAGTGKYEPRFITPQVKQLDPGETHIILDSYNPVDIRYLYLDVSGAGADNTVLTITSDTFYFSFSMSEMMNYNIHSLIRDIPSLILADPTNSHYIVMFKPIPPLHSNHRVIVRVENPSTDSVRITYAFGYSEEVE